MAHKLDKVAGAELKHPCEFPKLGLLLAQELIKCAAAGCPPILVRLEALREHRAESHSLSTGREALRFFARDLARSKGIWTPRSSGWT